MKTIYCGALFLLAASAFAQVGSPLPSTIFTRDVLRATNAPDFMARAGLSTNLTFTNLNGLPIDHTTGLNADMTAATNAITTALANAISTNSALAAMFSAGVYVSAAYGSDTNARPGPFASLSKAAAMAVPGETVYVSDGTFNEGSFGTNGVDWYFARGVILTNTYLNVSWPTNRVFGEVTWCGPTVAQAGFLTNTVALVRVDAEQIGSASSNLILDVGAAQSNVFNVWISARNVAGKFNLTGGKTNSFSAHLDVAETATLVPVHSEAHGTNDNLYVRCRGTVLQSANWGAIYYGNWWLSGGGTFSRNGFTDQTDATKVKFFFSGTWFNTTNDVPNSGTATNIYGSWFVKP